MPPPLDAALIGAGGFAQQHMSVLERLQDEDVVRTTAVADPRISEIATAAGWKYASSLRLYQDYQTLIAKESCDLISIATPPFLHLEMVEAALEVSRAHIYLEKPPVPLVTQLDRLLAHPEAHRVIVGFQFMEAAMIRSVKQRILDGEIGPIRAIRASSATPRTDDYYQRSSWAGRLTLGGHAVLDGPASNGLAHLVHLVMYFAGGTAGGFAVPQTVTGRFLRARPIESYDFAYLRGTFDRGTEYEIAVGHCSAELLRWCVTVEGDHGSITFRLEDIDASELQSNELLYRSYMSALGYARGDIPRPTSRLQDCMGYLRAVCGGFVASQGVTDIAPGEIEEIGTGPDRIYSVPKATEFIRLLPLGQGLPWFDVPPPKDATIANEALSQNTST